MKLGEGVNEWSFWWFCYASEEQGDVSVNFLVSYKRNSMNHMQASKNFTKTDTRNSNLGKEGAHQFKDAN